MNILHIYIILDGNEKVHVSLIRQTIFIHVNYVFHTLNIFSLHQLPLLDFSSKISPSIGTAI